MSKWSKKYFANIFFLSVFFLANLILLVNCSTEKDVIRIGSVLSLTGSASVWGENAQEGMELAVNEINFSGGIDGKMIKIIYEDSQSQPKNSVLALQKLIASPDIQVIIGDIASSNVLAMAPVAQNSKIILISPGASNPDISYSGDYIFRNFPSDALEGKIDGKYAYEQLKWNKIGIININNAYGQGVSKYFKEEFIKQGGEVLIDDAFAQGEIDFRNLLTNIKGKGLDGIYLPGYPEEMAKLIKQAREMKINVPFLSTQAFDDPQVLAIAGEALNGTIFSTPEPADSADEITKNLIEKYRKKYNKSPGLMSDTGYDAVKIIAQAIKKVGNSAKEIRKYLTELKNFPGAAGLTTFDEYGDVPRPFIFKSVANGQFTKPHFRAEIN